MARSLAAASSSVEYDIADRRPWWMRRAAGSSCCACAPSGSHRFSRNSTSVAAAADRKNSRDCHIVDQLRDARKCHESRIDSGPGSVPSHSQDMIVVACPSGSPDTSVIFVGLESAAVERHKAVVGLSLATVSFPELWTLKHCL